MASRARRITRTKPRDLRRRFAGIPEILAARRKNAESNVFWGTFVYWMFTYIEAAFLKKSTLQPDDLGNQWHDLTPAYKAYKRFASAAKGDRRLQRAKQRDTLGLLSKADHQRWKTVFGIVVRAERKKGELSEKALLKKAGQIAWYVLKMEDAPTMISVLGEKHVPVNILTGDLLRSLKPGRVGPRTGYVKGNPKQLASFANRRIVIGSGVKYASHVQELRKIWPDDMDGWIDRALDKAVEALEKHLAKQSASRRRQA